MIPRPKSGFIALISKRGVEVQRYRYENPTHRAEIIEQWRFRYGKQFNFMAYQISPYIVKQVEREEETNEMMRMRELGYTYERISTRFGKTKQCIRMRIHKRLREAS